MPLLVFFMRRQCFFLAKKQAQVLSCFLYEKNVPLLNEEEGAAPLLFHEKVFLRLSEEAGANTSLFSDEKVVLLSNEEEGVTLLFH